MISLRSYEKLQIGVKITNFPTVLCFLMTILQTQNETTIIINSQHFGLVLRRCHHIKAVHNFFTNRVRTGQPSFQQKMFAPLTGKTFSPELPCLFMIKQTKIPGQPG